MEAMTSDGLEGGRLKVVGLSIKAAVHKRGEGRGQLFKEWFVEGVVGFLREVIVPFPEHARVRGRG